MMNIAELRESLDIFATAESGEDSWILAGAEHDIIYTNFSEEDFHEKSDRGSRLIELGWHFDQDSGCWALFV